MKSLCETCKNCKFVTTNTSIFLMCLIKKPKYPPQPITECDKYQVDLTKI